MRDICTIVDSQHHCSLGVLRRFLFRMGAAFARRCAASLSRRSPHVLLLHASCCSLAASRAGARCHRAFAFCCASWHRIEAAGCQRVASAALQTKGSAGSEVPHAPPVMLMLPSSKLIISCSTYADGAETSGGGQESGGGSQNC